MQVKESIVTEEQVIIDSLIDHDFRTALLTNGDEAILAKYGQPMALDRKLVVLEDDERTVHLVLPPPLPGPSDKPLDRELITSLGCPNRWSRSNVTKSQNCC